MSYLFLPDPEELPDYTQGTQPCTPERLLAGRRRRKKGESR
jgi:hypothetical protein